jgi:chromate reductase
MKIIAIVGSLRKESFNLQLARTMQERYKGKFELEIVGLQEIPYFDQDEEINSPAIVNQMNKTIAEADGVLIITPEYNWSIPGVLKNAIDWLSRGDKVLIGKPVMTAGVSTGVMGTIRAQLHLREILACPGIQARVLPPAGNEILINSANNKFASGRLTDEPTLQFIDAVIDKFMDLVKN